MCDNNKTPLYNSLAVLAKLGTARFHMPGNKGLPRNCALDGAFEIDYTEIPETGNLYSDDGAIHVAEALVAKHYGAECCVFLTCGATQGVKSMLAVFCGAGGSVLLDRNCHKSAIDACALLDLSAEFICPNYLEEYGISADISVSQLENHLKQNPNIRAFLLTSPTYYGVNLNIEPIAELCHNYGVTLLVDSAHGSHLRVCGVPDAMMQGADCAVFSAHKTLGALTQGAYLVARAYTMDSALRKNASLFGTSSPSYPIMASLDLARMWLGTDDWSLLSSKCNSMRSSVQGKTNLRMPNLGDPCRLTVFSREAGYSGNALAKFLRTQGIEPEMSDINCTVCIATPADLHGNLQRLEAALLSLPQAPSPQITAVLPPTQIPPQALSIRQAMLGGAKLRALADCAGEVCAQTIAPYPPGVAVIVPGEIIYKEYIEYLHIIGYNIDNAISIANIDRL